MANRVLLGQRDGDYGLWISKPGQNVLTAPDGQLAFTSQFPAFGILEQGTHTIRWNTSGFSGSYNQSVNFQKNYGLPPLVWFDLPVGNRVQTFQVGSPAAYGIRVFQNGSHTLAEWHIAMRVLANRFVVTGSYDRQYTGYRIPDVTIRYTVYSFNF